MGHVTDACSVSHLTPRAPSHSSSSKSPGDGLECCFSSAAGKFRRLLNPPPSPCDLCVRLCAARKVCVRVGLSQTQHGRALGQGSRAGPRGPLLAAPEPRIRVSGAALSSVAAVPRGQAGRKGAALGEGCSLPPGSEFSEFSRCRLVLLAGQSRFPWITPFLAIGGPCYDGGQRPAPQDLKMTIRVSCIGRVIVIIQAILVSASGSSSGWGEEGIKFGAIGGNVSLSCSRAGSSSVVQWRFNGIPRIPVRSLAYHGHLVLFNVDLSAAGNYSCHDEDGRLLSTFFLRLGHPPGIPTVFCRVSDYENITCFWNASRETFLPTRYFATYRKHTLTEEEKQQNSHFITGTCLQDPARPNMCSVRNSEFWSSYTMNVTEENPLGASFRLLKVIMQSMVKPDPPESLVVEPVPLAPRRLRVTWDYPSTWPKSAHFLLKFRLQYRPVVHHAWSVVETANLTDVITDAFMGTEHVVQVSTKDFMDAGNWSDWSAEVKATPWISPTSKASDEIPTTEPDAEMPVEAPDPVVFDRSDPLEKIAVLASLGIFAFVILVVVLVIIILIWIRLRRKGKDGTKKHDFIAAIHMKALPKAQLL
ncbi:interleukin-11 receptor subunit alpha [Ambystoma mexicanum]|uniref:interleukin-11 receptor subunit alpha n=1 Tax=Ambystoma mexicanum TaxID=8296 RepID=UPI0037E94B38